MKETDCCKIMFNRLEENEELSNKHVSTDEGTFAVYSEVNSHNFRLVSYIHPLKKTKFRFH